jgi:hypothetical protein
MGKAHGFPIKRENGKKIRTKNESHFKEDIESVGEIHLVQKNSGGSIKEDWLTNDKQKKGDKNV